jgi:hypothetical protein
MSWHKRRTDDLANALRFVGWVFLALDTVLLAMFSFWFARNFLGFLKNWLAKTIFGAPW